MHWSGWPEAIRARLRLLFARGAAEARMDEEFRFHIEMETERLVREAGLDPAEARRRALVAFGGVERHRAAMRDGRGLRWLAELWQDARLTFRWLRRSPLFASSAVVTIALGIGVTTALFSVTNAFLLRPLPVSDPDALFVLQEVRWGAVSIGNEGRRIPYNRYEAYREATSDVFAGLAAHTFQSFSMRTADGAVAIGGVLASGNYFDVLGIRPALGAFFHTDDEPVVVLGHRFWRRRFGADPSVIGRTVYLDGRPYTVVGVGPEGFGGTAVGVAMDVWVPFRAHVDDVADMGRWVGMFGRLAAPDRVGRATEVVDAVAKRIPPDEPQTRIERAYLAPLTGLAEQSRGDVGAFLGLLLGTAFLVLLIAGANIAGMLLARSVTRRREVAIRAALGAGRGRLVRQHMTESVVLFLLGGLAGIILAVGATKLLSRIPFPESVPLVIDVAPDLRVLSFALSVALTIGLVFGLVPALRASHPVLVPALKEGGGAGGSARTRARGLFVAGQVAMAVLLLACAGLFVRGLRRAIGVDPGFRPAGVVVGTVNLDLHGYGEERGRAFYRQLLDAVRALPGVESAALARTILLTGSRSSNDVAAAGSDGPMVHGVAQNVVDTAYFGTMGIDLVAGRGFTGRDVAGAPRVVIINETLAARLWPGQNPLGRRIRRGSDEFEVIGVARDGKYVEPGEAPMPFAFYAFAQEYRGRMALHVRARGAPAQTIRAIRRAVGEIDADIALEDAMPLPLMLDFQLFPQRFATVLVGLFGVLGLLLAAIGVYGVMAFHVASRMREFGIRIALGARASNLVRSVLRRGIALAGIGAAVGLTIAAAVAPFLRAMLFGLSPFDPVTFAAVALILAAVAILASLIPARRALRADPMAALRVE
ncbi:MAG TPA: ABC transporter permease [Longimicrobiales bacterium]